MLGQIACKRYEFVFIVPGTDRRGRSIAAFWFVVRGGLTA
jgi:hypothetical protein